MQTVAILPLRSLKKANLSKRIEVTKPHYLLRKRDLVNHLTTRYLPYFQIFSSIVSSPKICRNSSRIIVHHRPAKPTPKIAKLIQAFFTKFLPASARKLGCAQYLLAVHRLTHTERSHIYCASCEQLRRINAHNASKDTYLGWRDEKRAEREIRAARNAGSLGQLDWCDGRFLFDSHKTTPSHRVTKKKPV